MYSQHSERHFSNRNNWLRASVLGANDGLISTASLLTGVAAAAPDFQTLLLTGVSALIGGAVSMAEENDADEAVYAGCVLLSGKGGVLVHDIGINGAAYQHFACHYRDPRETARGARRGGFGPSGDGRATPR